MKLWDKSGSKISEAIEKFTVGRDREFDILMARFDVEGSIAHVTMLGEVGLMSKEESAKAVDGLKEILKEIEEGKFKIEEGVEDVHSQVEFLLTKKIGDAGKKIHSGRSRNDQVAVDIKLFLRSEIHHVKALVGQLFNTLIKQSEAFKNHLIPGYTHLQIAMPSSVGLWLGAYAESLVDDMELMAASFAVINKNPLGSGAGYGSSFPLDRKQTTELLGFADLNYNSVYAQMTRGKAEKVFAFALASLATTLSRLSMDVCLYMNQNFGFISFPSELTTGSSIMPHKKNPDVFELVRGKCNRIQSVPNELAMLVANLPSGYHRDLQLTKEILFTAISDMKDCLEITEMMLQHLQVNEGVLQDPKYKYLFSVEAVNKLVNEGISFRDAYKIVGEQIEKGEFEFDQTADLKHSHLGSIGELANREIKRMMENVMGKIRL